MLLLIEPLIPALRRYARALLRDRETADDIVQDCLERAIARWGQRRADGDARTWLLTILHNLAISHFRQASRRGVHGSLDEVDETATAVAPTQEDNLRHGDLLAALKSLPEDQRTVLLLISIEDLSYAQASIVLGVPIGTVMSRLARGRERLRRTIATGTAAQRPALRRVK